MTSHRELAVANGSVPMTVQEALLSARGHARSVGTQERLGFARGMVSAAVRAYWSEMHGAACYWSLCEAPSDVHVASLPLAAEEVALTIGACAARMDVGDASYTIGLLYTGVMPEGLRAKLGAYYTPPSLCEQLLEMATEAGVDWRSARVLDPACGGGAFLAPVALRMVANLHGYSAEDALKEIVRRLHGFEIDPFAAWMSQVFLEVALYDLCQSAGRRLPNMVRVCHSLEQTPDFEGFNLVVGNPPYGRATLSPQMRGTYLRSLFGHANLYGLFTDMALRFCRPGGVVAYVTPTSFLSGEYFKALRGLLGEEAPPVSIAFIEKRSSVFADVLQETMLAAYRRGERGRFGQVHFISCKRDGSINATEAGPFRLPERSDRPWIIPRTKTQAELVARAAALHYRLVDYGYRVSTGPLVWNRHKQSLRDTPGEGRYPLIWAESVRSQGVFEFRAQRRNHKPYFEPKTDECWVATDFPCVLLQRTTAKEQGRRLVAAVLPLSFLHEHRAVVIENHLNMIRPIDGPPSVSPGALAALLNSAVVDQLFRCISGSVAVSAYELESLPLPSPDSMKEIEQLVRAYAQRQSVESAVEHLYWNGY